MPALVQRGVTRTLFGMALPMLAASFAMNAYNLTDTWFVSRLGTAQLAAMGFTFPVVMLLMCVARGIGNGITTLASTAMGQQDHAGAARVVTHGLMFTLAAIVAMAVPGYVLIDPVFRALGADDTTLPLIASYMRIWYIGTAVTVVPMFGNGLLIAAGDAKTASKLMICGTVLNVILDPILIFGYLGCPAMGIAGASLATVLAKCVPTVWLIWRLGRTHHLFAWGEAAVGPFLKSLRSILRFAIPGTLGMILMPISATVITKLVSTFGYQAVAACGAAGRIEMFAFMVPMALGMSLTPFVSQNFGAKRFDRLSEAHRTSARFAIGYGALTAIVFVLGAPWLAAAFTRDPKVTETLITYIRIIAFGYGMMEVHRYCGFFLTGMHRPIAATMLGAVRVLVLLIPLSYLGTHVGGITGLFAGRLAADLVSGTIGLFWVASVFRARLARQPADPDAGEPAAVYSDAL